MSNNQEEYLACLGLSHFQKIGPAGWRKLKNYFPDISTAFSAPTNDWERAGLSPALAYEFIVWRRSFSAARATAELAKNNIKFITIEHDSYPPLLKEIHAAPPFLYYMGASPNHNMARLAVVGARIHSPDMAEVMKTLISPLAGLPLEIVSGLALGVDTDAHRSALAAQLRTAAVLGSGLNNIYPRDNLRLADKIIETGGTILSEFPPGTPPHKSNFPRRNRIISGLCQATLVVEADYKSGAMVTAAYALEQNREVLAVPGSILSAYSSGPNRLIKDGAIPIHRAEDIIDALRLIK